MENEGQNPTPAVDRSKKWYQHNGIPTIIILAIIATGASWFYFKLSQTPAYTGDYGMSQQGIAPSNQQAAPTLSYAGPIAQFCSSQKKSSGNYSRGEVAVIFSSSMSPNDIHKYLSDKGYQTVGGDANQYLLNMPTEVDVYWSDAFTQKNQATPEEVNSFLEKAAQEPYIQSIEPKVAQINNKNNVQLFDRWGYFTITFNNQAGESQFFKDYPEATLFGDGQLQGQYLINENGIYQAVVLYKAQPVLDILNKIKAQAGISDGSVRQMPSFGLHGSSEQQLGIFLTPFYITGTTHFALNVPADNSNIKDILMNYSDIDLAQTLPTTTPAYEQRLNVVNIEVPVGEEQCYASELSKQSDIVSAEVNNIFQEQ